MNRYHVVEENNTGTTGRWKVSAKIQQLLNTLKRPKRRPLPEFYEDDDIELEIAANPKDPNAPKPEGGTMTPAVGETLSVPSGLPRSVEASIQRFVVRFFYPCSFFFINIVKYRTIFLQYKYIFHHVLLLDSCIPYGIFFLYVKKYFNFEYDGYYV